jgi:glycosyltransferase involved in cell wall biosynthesis
MRVLMLAPHPVYAPRGTPISVFNRCRALCALGHRVTLVTYPIGRSVPVEGLTYHRAWCPGFRRVDVGPSFAKLVLDGAVAARSLLEGLAGRGRFDVVHAHEEAGLFAPAAARLAGAPFVYDMGNDWAVVLGNYGLGDAHPAVRAARLLERWVLRRAAAVIAQFPSLAQAVRDASGTPVETVYNVSLDPDPDPGAVEGFRRRWSPAGERVVLYTGTLEPYQGIPTLLDAVAQLVPGRHDLRLVIAGGTERQVEATRRRAVDLGVAGAVELVGTLGPEVVPAALAAADALVSPRATGTNTPLKIFSYLRSGTPIVATDIPAHRQVLDPASCALVAPTAAGLAEGIGRVLDGGPAVAAQRAGARALDERYGVAGHLGAIGRAYAQLGAPEPGPGELQAAVERLAAWSMPGVGVGEPGVPEPGGRRAVVPEPGVPEPGVLVPIGAGAPPASTEGPAAPVAGEWAVGQ